MKKKKKRTDVTDAWPFVKWVESRQQWKVDGRLGKSQKGVEHFDSKEEAMQRRSILQARRKSQGNDAFDGARLAEFGWTVPQAIKFAIQNLEKQSASVPLSHAIAKLIEARKQSGISQKYADDLRLHLGRLEKSFPENQKISVITTEDLQKFLDGLEHPKKNNGEEPKKLAPQTVNSFRRDICTLWSFGAANSRKWCEASTARDTAQVKHVSETVGILTVPQLQTLLDNGEDTILPGLVIGAFCGLRHAEISKLDWSAIDLGEGIIQIDARIAKTSARRTVRIPHNAIAWLERYYKTAGAVISGNYRHTFDRVRVRAGFLPSTTKRDDNELTRLISEAKQAKRVLIPWKPNALRHSAISYSLALDKADINYVATQAGNSPAVIRAHYLELVKPNQARAYFDIYP